jgi:prepilin-type N-terminal cleavage/methylation domain-containing protein
MKILNTRGFTLIEMLVATTVFSVILIVCSMGLLQITRTFYKGVTVTKTQEVARTVIDDVASSVEFSGGSVTAIASNNGSRGYCAGNVRYSYYPGRMLPEDGTTHSLVADRLDTATPTPLTCGSSISALDLTTGALPASGRELLGARMRVARFDLSCVGATRLCTVGIRLVTGEDDLLTTPANSPTAGCRGLLAGAQFCTSVELTTVIQKRVQ